MAWRTHQGVEAVALLESEAALVEASKAGNATRSQRLMGCSWVIGDATDANDDPLSNGITALEDDLDSHSMVNLQRMLTLATDLTPPVALHSSGLIVHSSVRSSFHRFCLSPLLPRLA